MSKNEYKVGERAIYDARELGTGKMIVLGLQHMFAMFGATVVVPLITGLNVSTTLLFAGLGTLLFHLISKKRFPHSWVPHSHSLAVMRLSLPLEQTARPVNFCHMPASASHAQACFTLFSPRSSKRTAPAR